MKLPNGLDGGPLALLTDLYQLTMCQGYWRLGRADDEAVFHLFFRRAPFGGSYAIACGLETVLNFVDSFRIRTDDIEYLRSVGAPDGSRLFCDDFLEYLTGLRLSCDIDAVEEGTVVFPHEPLVRVSGRLIEAQLLESALLNWLNFPTLVATKASRICAAAQGDSVIEFGMRRAQGMDGALTASRAAFVGGCVATSNVLAGKLYGIPVRGTHAHSWVQSFDDELESFQSYAKVMPANTLLLVDTFDTIAGVHNAIRVASELRANGYRFLGVRLDSGDLTSLSIEARRLLDEAGFKGADIVASNDLDEYRIERLKKDGARINVWGVGTRLATAFDEPALGGVYKLAAVRSPGSDWEYRIKRSDDSAKTSIPGKLQTKRFLRNGSALGDVIYCEADDSSVDGALESLSGERSSVADAFQGAQGIDLLQPVVRAGKVDYVMPSIQNLRARAQKELETLGEPQKRAQDPEPYSVFLEGGLAERRRQLIRKATAGGSTI